MVDRQELRREPKALELSLAFPLENVAAEFVFGREPRPILAIHFRQILLEKRSRAVAEGIGQGRVTKNVENIKVDRDYRIPDQAGLTIVYQLLRQEGLFLGLSSGINVAGAVRFARESGPGQTIVTVLCDSGQKYQSTLFNRDWLASNYFDPDLPLESVLASA